MCNHSSSLVHFPAVHVFSSSGVIDDVTLRHLQQNALEQCMAEHREGF